jgi:hypothetical protein
VRDLLQTLHYFRRPKAGFVVVLHRARVFGVSVLDADVDAALARNGTDVDDDAVQMNARHLTLHGRIHNCSDG